MGNMSWTDEEIDDLYRESTEKLHFEYKEAYWKEMEAMLPKKRGGDGLWYLFSLGFMALFGVLMVQPYFTSNFPSKKDDQTASQKSSERALNANQITVSVLNSTESSREKNPSANIKEQDALNTRNHSTQAESPKKLQSNSTRSTDRNSGNLHVQEVIFQLNTIEENLPIDEERSIQLVNNETFPDMNKEIGVLEPRRLQLTSNSEQHVLTFIPGNIVNQWLFAVYGQLNTSIAQSLITPSKEISYAYGAGAGLSMQKGRFSLNVGLGYGVAHYSDLTLTRTAKVYGFGSTIYNYDIRIDQMYKLDGHLEAGWQMNRSIIRVNLRPDYLLNTRVRYTQTSGIENTIQTEERTAYGYTEGLTRFGLRAGLGYAYRLTPTIELGLNAGVQTIKMVDESFISGKNNPFAIDGQLFIRKLIPIK